MGQYVRYDIISMPYVISNIFIETYLVKRRKIPIVFAILVDVH